MGIEHQLQRYVVYSCKKCGWQTAVLAQWADLKPKKCPNKKCGCFFLKEPGQLDVKMPPKPETAKVAPSKTLSKRKSKKNTNG